VPPGVRSGVGSRLPLFGEGEWEGFGEGERDIGRA
jgi:hypothetical protein